MRYKEREIIYMIINDIHLESDIIDEYITYVNRLDKLSSSAFDRHCRIINSLKKSDFNKYVSFLSIYVKDKGE